MYKLNREGSERILSDLRLKNSYIEGTIEKTGNIFVDKPWVVNYNDNAQVIDLHDTLYNNYQKYAINHLDEPAIFDPTKDALYTHRQVLDLIDKAMHGFKAMGIGENSKVGIVINGHIEEPIIFMALNALGATQKYIDFMKSVPAMIHSANEADLDLLVLEEMFLPLEGAINGKGLPIVVTNNAQEYTDDKHIDFAKLTTMGQDLEVSPVAYEEGKPTIIISSSGTTGDPKPIVHSDYKVNAAAQKMLYTDYPLESGNVMLKMMPAQLGLGLVTSLYTSLASGCVVTMIGGVEAEDLVKQMVGFTMNFEAFKKKANLKDDAII